MAGLKIMAQAGYTPRVAPHLLQDNEAQKAINTKLQAGDLRSWKKPLRQVNRVYLADDVETIYKGKKFGGDDLWLAWSSDVDVVRSPLSDNIGAMSIYYTGDGVPKKTNSLIAGTIQGTSPANWYNLGVPAPASSPAVAVVGSTGTIAETRVYCYTYVSTFGDIEEESAPSPISGSINLSAGQSITVSGFSARPTSHYNITKIRVYRSVSGSSATSFFLVDEIPSTQTSYIDAKTSAQLGEALGTTGWDVPPSDLRGLVLLPNNFVAGFSGDSLYFSEVNAYHAFPTSYSLSLGVEIVGLGVYGQSIAVLTKGYPYIVTGVSPESMTAERVPSFEPCIAKRSICSDASGVMYASANGICAVGAGISGVTTGSIMSRDDFLKFNPYSFRCAISGGKLFAFYEQATETVEKGGMILDRNTPATPLSITTIPARAIYVDPESADLYLAADGEVKTWDADEVNPLPYEWLSKKFVFTAPANLGALEVNADFANILDAQRLQQRVEQIIAQNQAMFSSYPNLKGTLNAELFAERTINGSLLLDIPRTVDNRYLLVTLIVDDKVVYTGQYTAAGVYRLPSGFKGQVFEVKIAGNIECRYLKLAETAKELKAL